MKENKWEVQLLQGVKNVIAKSFKILIESSKFNLKDKEDNHDTMAEADRKSSAWRNLLQQEFDTWRLTKLLVLTYWW